MHIYSDPLVVSVDSIHTSVYYCIKTPRPPTLHPVGLAVHSPVGVCEGLHAAVRRPVPGELVWRSACSEVFIGVQNAAACADMVEDPVPPRTTPYSGLLEQQPFSMRRVLGMAARESESTGCHVLLSSLWSVL